MEKSKKPKARLDYYSQEEDGERRDYVHFLGYFDSYLSEAEGRLVTALAYELTKEGERLLLAFYPICTQSWEKVEDEDWVTLHSASVPRWGLFRKKVIPWIVGYACTREKFREVLMYAWNISGNDTVLAIPMNETNLSTLVEAFDCPKENLAKVIGHYPTVISRGHDGLWLKIQSRDWKPTDMLGKLREITDREIVYREKPL